MDGGGPQALDIDLKTAFGRLRGRLSVPPNPIRLAELAYSFLALDQQLIEMAAAADRKAGHAVSCAKGCSACCNQIVPLSPAEAWMVADLVRSLPDGRRQTVLDRFRETRSRLDQAGFGGRYQDTEPTLERVVSMSTDYNALGLDCPFLEDHACSIHPHRPAICREFLATTPASHCSTPEATFVRSVPLAARFTECLSKVSAMVMGGEPQVIPLSLALEWAEENREAGQLRHDPTALMTAMFRFIGGNHADPGLSGPSKMPAGSGE